MVSLPKIVNSIEFKVHKIFKKPSNYRTSQPPNWRQKRQGFTLIELLVVIAILTIMAAAVIAAVNPAKRSRQARDAARKQHINNIANALIGYYTLTFHYPGELVCDSTVYTGNFPCGIVAP